MNIIIRQAKIVDPKSPFHNQIVDVKINNGVFEKISTTLPKENGYQEIEIPNLHLSQGWFDSSVSLGEPGFEDRETIANGLQVAAKSGFTAIALQPNSFPVIDNQSQVHFVQQKANGSATEMAAAQGISNLMEANAIYILTPRADGTTTKFTPARGIGHHV